MLDRVLFRAAKFLHVKRKQDDDLADRMSYIYSAGLLVGFCFIVSMKQFVGTPIVCWVPHEYSDAWQTYVNNYCWIRNTYYIPFENDGRMIVYPPSKVEKYEKELTYYQWVPIMLLVQAVMFIVPNFLWRLLNERSGISLQRLSMMAMALQYTEPSERREKLEYCARHLEHCLDRYRHKKNECCHGCKTWCANKCFWFMCRRRYGNFLVPVYFMTKLLYLLNSIGQLFLLNAFLGVHYTIYGLDVMLALIKGTDWTESDRFPRITMCDYHILQTWNVQPWTVQCVLPINLFNEKIYLFLWFWLVIVSGLTLYSLIWWVWVILCFGNRFSYVTSLLQLSQGRSGFRRDRKVLDHFITDFLRNDGVLTLRMLSKNSNDVIVAELTSHLYELYAKKNDRKRNDVTEV